jgi:outer membrane protein OmpA-like peptidoglycan-associated protein
MEVTVMPKLIMGLILMFLFQGNLFAQDKPLSDQYRQALKPPPKTYPKGVGNISIPSGSEATLVLNLQFKINSYEILSESIRSLDALGTAIGEDKELRGYKYRIEGHTCTLGNPELNRQLSEKRAEAVKTYLVRNYHLSEKQFEVIGYGADRPVASNDTEEGRRLNRRVVVKNTLQKNDSFENQTVSMDVYVKYLKDSREVELKDNDILTQKNGYAVEFSPKGKTFVYVYQITNSDKVERLFPNNKFSGLTNPVGPGKLYRIPNMGKWLHLDSTKGKEQLVVIANRGELKNPEQFLGKQSMKQTPKGPAGTIEIKLQKSPDRVSNHEDTPSDLFLWKRSFNHN